MPFVSVRLLKETARLPAYETAGAAGADLCACLDAPVTILPGQTVLIATGLAMAIPEGCVGLVFARSGLATKQDLAPANKVGVIDSDYRGEIFVPLHNHGKLPRTVESGERIAQFLLTPVLTAQFVPTDTLDSTDRGENGFGSTGV